ncbi:MAG: TraB/GumN family protein [Caulobacterales bacterium]|uniref:TraB/GumN family protein n=1 Tax=Glycocaulis sp. TaxID=1969725 RepID=UPI003F9F06C2
MLRAVLPALLIGLAAMPAFAHQDRAASPASPEEVIVVRGERSGPQLWRVTHPERPGEIYVFATVGWLPEGLEWNDRPVESVLEEASLVLTDFEIDAGAISTTRIVAMMLRTVLFNRSRLFMPRGTTLADRVGPDLAAQFDTALATAHVRRDRLRQERRNGGDTGDVSRLDPVSEDALEGELANLDTRRLHPFFQANMLIGEAAASIGVSSSESVTDAVARLARRARVPTRPVQTYSLAVSDISDLMRRAGDFSAETNTVCIEEAIDFATSGLPQTWLVAQSWARGDASALQAGLEDTADARQCQFAVERELGGLSTLGGQYSDEIDYAGQWQTAMEAALAEGGVTLAVITARGWLRSGNGVRERLEANGFVVEGP